MGAVWRGPLLRRTLALTQLFGLDMLFSAGCGAILGAVALLAYSFPPAHYTCLVYASPLSTM